MKIIKWDKEKANTYYRCFVPNSVLAGAVLMRSWCKNNCSGNVMVPSQNNHWFFELEEDAVAFKLVWL